MKKRAIGLVVAATVLGTAGCGVELNDKQTGEVAEYAAGLIVKYDKDYNESLIYPEVTPSPIPTLVPKRTYVPTATPSSVRATDGTGKTPSGSNDAPTDGVEYTLDQVLGVKNVSISCKGVKLMDEYAEKGNDYFRVYPSKGKKLAVVSLQIKNTSDTVRRVYLAEMGVSYKLKLADGTTNNAQLTVVSNDLNYLNTSIKAKKKKTAVLIFEVSEKASLKGAELEVVSGERKAVVSVGK
ncbi:MAG: hypothetical protein IIT46_14945 [Lachnospiraceae bacterium]|nr:hypothetical protein [Lachnospiraceae bacterium]